MGRYDKIKVYNGSAWVKPTHLRIYNGSGYTDLGKDDSDNKTPLHVYDADGNLQRVTLNKTVNTVAGEKYTSGAWNMLPIDGYNWNWTAAAMAVECMVRRTDASDKRIFYVGKSGSYFDVWWLADGRIRIRSQYNGGTVSTRYSSNYVTATNTWVYLYIYTGQQNSNGQGSLNWNHTVTTIWTNAFEVSGTTNVVGSDGIHFKSVFTCQGRKYSYGITHFSKNMETISGTDGSTYQNVNHVDTSYETITWE